MQRPRQPPRGRRDRADFAGRRLLSSGRPQAVSEGFQRPEGPQEGGGNLKLDFKSFGPHSLRRANISWRQEVGGSSIETSKIAGHSSTAITEEYTIVQLNRQDQLTRRIQDKRAKAAKKAKKVVELKKKGAAA